MELVPRIQFRERQMPWQNVILIAPSSGRTAVSLSFRSRLLHGRNNWKYASTTTYSSLGKPRISATKRPQLLREGIDPIISTRVVSNFRSTSAWSRKKSSNFREQQGCLIIPLLRSPKNEITKPLGRSLGRPSYLWREQPWYLCFIGHLCVWLPTSLSLVLWKHKRKWALLRNKSTLSACENALVRGFTAHAKITHQQCRRKQ